MTIEVVIERQLNVGVEFNRVVSGEALPVPFTNSSGSYSGNAVLPGLDLPDITLTYPNGAQITVPSVEAYTILFLVLYITNSAQEQLDELTAYPFQGRIVLNNIEIYEVDGSTSIVAGGKNHVCAFPMLEVINADGDTLIQISAYPTDGNINLQNQAVSIRNSQNDEIEAVVYENNAVVNIGNITITDSEDVETVVAAANEIEVSAGIETAVTENGVLSITVIAGAEPSGFCYHTPIPSFNLSFATGDSHSNFLAGNFRRTDPAVPATIPRIKHNATQADVRSTPATGTTLTDEIGPTILEEDNEHGNRFRFTDTIGNPSDAAVGSDKHAHVNFKDHSFTGAIAETFIDHLTGLMYTTKYADDAGKVNLNVGSNDWEQWMAFIDGEHHGLTGWMPLDLSDLSGPVGARVHPNMVWANNCFSFDPAVSGDERGGFITGESYDINDFYILYDSGNPDICLKLTKSTNSGFQSRLSNIFMKRIHFNIYTA